MRYSVPVCHDGKREEVKDRDRKSFGIGKPAAEPRVESTSGSEIRWFWRFYGTMYSKFRRIWFSTDFRDRSFGLGTAAAILVRVVDRLSAGKFENF